MIVTQCYNAGGILDRVDSYVFTGALCYSFVRVALPLYGVWLKHLAFCCSLSPAISNRVTIF